ncbi:helix-turn-helix domain-containing protein [Nocardia tengchongensis]|uniref:helix-turn-helix domain-containing protein n=1 Tax=Nocardia tengchongensis TaxID=2055889 RepID=UPI0036C50F78
MLGALSMLDPLRALTCRQLCRAAGLPDTSVHRALLRLSRTGLAVSTFQGPVRWRSTDRGRVTLTRAVYREYIGVRP